MSFEEVKGTELDSMVHDKGHTQENYWEAEDGIKLDQIGRSGDRDHNKCMVTPITVVGLILATVLVAGLLSHVLSQGQTAMEQDTPPLAQSTTFPFPTVGMPTPNTPYNSTRVLPEQLSLFDNQVNSLFQPYAVLYAPP